MIQAVLNIVKNAQQALENRGTIFLRTRTLRRYTIGHHVYRLVLKLDIIDNGPGVPSSLIDQIFFPMVTTRADGTGLGLSIAQTIVTQHEGVIECTSVAGETVFSILLPIERQALGNNFHEGK
jgi:two-component system nitrogen regulation sensor histidine kinase GlnL